MKNFKARFWFEETERLRLAQHYWEIVRKNNPGMGGTDRVREQVRLRDRHTCQLCDKLWKKGERRFDVHHLDLDKNKTRACENYIKDQNNMVTLCHKCHLRLHHSK